MPGGDRSNKVAIAVDEPRCIHAHSVWGICARCVNACPGEAISLDKKTKLPAVDASKCLGCGQCLSVCPLGVFSSHEFTEGGLLSRIEPTGAVRLRCFLPYGELSSLAGNWDAYHLGTCLVALSPGVLYQIALERRCELATDRCEGCSLFAKVSHTMRMNFTAAHDLLADCGRSSNLRETTPLFLPAEEEDEDVAVPASQQAPNVRAMFRAIYRAVRKEGPMKRPVLPLRAHRKRVPGWRVRLADDWNRVSHVESQGAYRWPRIDVNADVCRACGICMQLCPTGAISHAFGGGVFEYAHIPGACVDCGLCIMSCPAQAITCGYDTYAQPFEETVCYTREAIPCPQCGMPVFVERGEKLCRLCQISGGSAAGGRTPRVGKDNADER